MIGAGLLLALLSAAPASQEAPAASPSPSPLIVQRSETVTWAIRYNGVTAGTAWARSEPTADGQVQIEGGAKNAPWYGSIYSIDDWVRSTALSTGGSQRYETRFREGGFQQDQDMRLAGSPFEVWRKQLIKGEWKEWTREYPAHPGAEDPISAILRLRLLKDEDRAATPFGEGWTFPVFSGDKTWPLFVQHIGSEAVEVEGMGTVQARILELRTEHKGLLEQRGRFRIWLSEDERRLPVKMVVKSNYGPIRADLIGYQGDGAGG